MVIIANQIEGDRNMNHEKNDNGKKTSLSPDWILIVCLASYLLINTICIAPWDKYNSYCNLGAFAGLSLFLGVIPLLMRGHGINFNWVTLMITTILMFLSFFINITLWASRFASV